MTDRRTRSEAALAQTSWLSFLKRLWPWVLLAFAAIVFVIRFTPGYFRASMDTETIVLPVFYQDVIVAHHPSVNWAWGGFSALFPDDLVYFGLNYLVGNGLVALPLLEICFFATWLGATVALVLELDRPNKLGLCSILLVLWVGLVCNFGLPNDWGLIIERSLLLPVYHSGTGVMTAICFVLLLHLIGRGWGIGYWWLLVLSFLASASDMLFDAVFIGPSLVTLILLAIAFRANWKWYLAIAVNLAVAGAVARSLAARIFPPALATDHYLEFSWDHVRDSLAALHDELFRQEHHLFAFVMVLDILTMLGGFGGLLFFCFSSRRRYISAVVFALMIFCSSCIFANWSAVLVMGDYFDGNANRYTTVALMIPLFILAFGLHSIILWRPWRETFFAAMASAFTLGVAFIPQESSGPYDGVMGDIPYLKKLMQENDIHYCLGSYWCANIVTYLSHGEVVVRSLTNDAKIYEWFNSKEWFGKGHPLSELPHYRLIYGPDPGFKDTFGTPDQVLHAPSGAEVWIYSPAHSILYNANFDLLSNGWRDDGMTLHMNSSALPGSCRIDGTARQALNGDNADWLQYGPYLTLGPGHYRATFHYTYAVLPTAGQEPTYDLDAHNGDKEESSHGKPLPSTTTDPQVFQDDFTVIQPGLTYEMRIYYHGSGSIRVESLDITCLLP